MAGKEREQGEEVVVGYEGMEYKEKDREKVRLRSPVA